MEAADRTCPHCRQRVAPLDTQCMNCGTQLSLQPAQAQAPQAETVSGRDLERAKRHAADRRLLGAAERLRWVVIVVVLGVIAFAAVWVFRTLSAGIRVAHYEYVTVKVGANEAKRIALAGAYAGYDELVENSIILAVPEGAVTQDDEITLTRIADPALDQAHPDLLPTPHGPIAAAARIEAKSERPPAKPLELTVSLVNIRPDEAGLLFWICHRPEGDEKAPNRLPEQERVGRTMVGHYSLDKDRRVIPEARPKETTPVWLEWQVQDWGEYYVYPAKQTIIGPSRPGPTQ